MARAPTPPPSIPALDAAALLRRIGFFGLFVIMPVAAQVARRAVVILAPISIAFCSSRAPSTAVRGRSVPAFTACCARPPSWPAPRHSLGRPVPGLDALPEPGDRAALNLVATFLMTMAGYLALPDRMRSANLYLLPVGVAAAALARHRARAVGDSAVRASTCRPTRARSRPGPDPARPAGLAGCRLAALARARRRGPRLALARLVALLVSPGPTTLVALVARRRCLRARQLPAAARRRASSAFTGRRPAGAGAGAALHCTTDRRALFGRAGARRS